MRAWKLLPPENPLCPRVVLSCPPQISCRPLWSDNSRGKVRGILLASWIKRLNVGLSRVALPRVWLTMYPQPGRKTIWHLLRSQLNKNRLHTKTGPFSLCVGRKNDSFFLHPLCRYVGGVALSSNQLAPRMSQSHHNQPWHSTSADSLTRSV